MVYDSNQISTIIGEVADMYELTVDDILSDNRKAPRPMARHVAAYILKEHEGMSCEDAGKALGNKRPSSVMYGAKKIRIKIGKNPVFKSIIEKMLKRIYGGKVHKKTTIITITGKSGAGKTTMAKILAQMGIPPVRNVTTRKLRPSDFGMKRVSRKQFEKIKNKIAETEYGGELYAGMRPNIDESEYGLFSYVIDEKGIQDLEKLDEFNLIKVLIITPYQRRVKFVGEERCKRKYVGNLDANDYDHVIFNNFSYEVFEKRCRDIAKDVIKSIKNRTNKQKIHML